MPKFSKNLLEEMYEANVRFDKILHIPTQTAATTDRVSEEFQDFLNDAYEERQSASLLAQCPSLESTLHEIRENQDIAVHARDVAQDLYDECGDFEFLILIEVAYPFDFSFKPDGEHLSNRIGGRYITEWILANDMNQAAELAIQKSKEIWESECEKSKREKGIFVA